MSENVISDLSQESPSVSKKERIKIHFRNNEKFYKGVGVGVLIAMAFRRPMVINHIAPVFHNNNASNVLMGGYLTKIVRNTDTGQIWRSVTEAADAVGIPIQHMSRHLNGHTPDVYGQVYEIIGVAN
jgi:hypothetical protein